MPSLLLIEAIISSVPIFIAMFAMKDSPKYPPSYSAVDKCPLIMRIVV